MNIPLNADWRITSSPHEWAVQKRRVVKGRDIWKSQTYHKTFDKACLSLAQRQLRDLDTDYRTEDLIGFCAAVDSLKDAILAALENAELRPPRDPKA